MSEESDSPAPDVFISYASEERENMAQPLAELLRGLGLLVWFDQFELKLGDSLRRTIDKGLGECRFGVVLLSPNFFGKHWTNRELDGLAQREVDGQKVILPIWCGVNDADVRRYSAPLADRVAARWEEGLHILASKILEVVRPDILDKLQEKYGGAELLRIRTGQELAALIRGSHLSRYYNDTPNSEEVDLISGFLQEVQDWGDIWNDLGPGEQVRTELRLGELIEELETSGWTVFGRKEVRRSKFAGIVDNWVWTNMAVLRGEAKRVSRAGEKIIVLRKQEAEE